jgi:membrane carboxypeptidase/penicillin-binding protein PbpC
LYIPGVSSERPCSIHVAVKSEGETAARVIEVWPDELGGWLRQHGGRPPATSRTPGRMSDDGSKPQIISPMPRQTYVLEEGAGDRQKLLFQAASAGGRVYWFVDGALYRDCPPDEPTFWTLSRGDHKVTCSDDSGHSATVAISVQ